MPHTLRSIAFVLCVTWWLSAAHGDELLFPNSDFETGTLAGWTADGDAFTVQPTKGDNPKARNREGSQHQGEFWIGTYERYDDQAIGDPRTRLGVEVELRIQNKTSVTRIQTPPIASANGVMSGGLRVSGGV